MHSPGAQQCLRPFLRTLQQVLCRHGLKSPLALSYGARWLSCCAGDTIHGLKDRRWVSFMWSYPLYVPLPAEQVRIGAHHVQALGALLLRGLTAGSKQRL